MSCFLLKKIIASFRKSERYLNITLDLDETLVHVVDEGFEYDAFSKYQHNHLIKDKDNTLRVYYRPFLERFLELMKDNFYVSIWSSGTPVFVNAVLDSSIFEGINFKIKKTIKDCKVKSLPEWTNRYVKIKPTNKLFKVKDDEGIPFGKARTIMVDNSPGKVTLKACLAYIDPWFPNNTKDDLLIDLFIYLYIVNKSVKNITEFTMPFLEIPHDYSENPSFIEVFEDNQKYKELHEKIKKCNLSEIPNFIDKFYVDEFEPNILKYLSGEEAMKRSLGVD